MRDQVFVGLGMNVLDGVLVAQAPDSIEDAALRQFQSGLLSRVHATSPRGVIIDVSRVRLLDSASYALLADAGRMTAMLGARVVFVGFQPGVVATLMDLDVDTQALVTALSLEDGMELLRPRVARADADDTDAADPANAAEDAADDDAAATGAAAGRAGPGQKAKTP